VAVIAMSSSDKWRTPAGLALVGPSYFGYDVPFIPVEQRYRA